MLEGLRYGFHLAFSPSQKLKSTKKNKPTAAQHPSVVDQYLANEVSLGRVAGLPWWYQFFEDWHGVNFWLFPGLLLEADAEVFSDAAGLFGYGAYIKGHWFAGSWVLSQQLQSIAYKELFPILLAAHVWGHLWVKKHVLFHSDNDAVAHILIKYSNL